MKRIILRIVFVIGFCLSIRSPSMAADGNHTVRFERGEPICMIVPMDRGLAESLQPICQPISSSPQTENAFAQWREARTKFNQGLAELQPEFVKRGWQRDYMLGKNSDGETFPEHQSALRLRPFRREH